jgi:hypothetical protein
MNDDFPGLDVGMDVYITDVGGARSLVSHRRLVFVG